MQPAVLAFSGSIASGKSTLSEEVAKTLQWSRVSFGDYVRFAARNQGLAESREVLQAIGADLVKKDVQGFCRSVLAQANWFPGQPIIIDGIRHMIVLNKLREIVAPLELYLIFIMVDEVTRVDRLLKRGDINLTKYKELEQDSTEEQVKYNLICQADLIVDGRCMLNELTQQIIGQLKLS